MADKFDQEDPFKKYGGNQIDQEDPFKKYGGVSIEEPSKKKVGSGIGGKVGSSVGRLDVGAGITEIDDKGKPVGGALSRVSGITTPEQAKISRVNKAFGKIESFAGSREDFEEIYKQAPQEFDNLAKQVAPNVNKGEIDKFYTTEAARKDALVDRVFQSYNQQKTKAQLESARRYRPVIESQFSTATIPLSNYTGKQYQLPQSEAQVSEILSDLNNEKEKLKTELTTNWNLSEVQTKAKELSEIEAAIRQNLTYQVGRMALERLSQNNPNVTSKDIGKEIFRVLHPDEYDLYEKVGGDKPVSFTVGTQRDTPVEADALNEQMVKLGNEIKRMYGNETAIQDSDIEEQTAKRKYTFQRQAQVKQKIAAILHERGLSPDKATEELKDKVVNKYLPDEDKEIWYNNNKIYNNVDLPSTGLGYSFKNDFNSFVKDAVSSTFGFLLPNRQKARAAEVLAESSESKLLGEDPQYKARLGQLKAKEEQIGLSDKEKEEKESLETYTNIRSKWEKRFDLAGTGLGTIMAMGTVSAFTGGLLNARNIPTAIKSLIAPSQASMRGRLATSVLTFYESNARNALKEYPNDKDWFKRGLKAGLDTAVDSLTEMLFPEEKILSGIGKMEVAKMVSNLTAKNLNATLNSNVFKDIARAMIGGSKRLVAVPLQEGAEELIAATLKEAYDGAINPDPDRQALDIKQMIEIGENTLWSSGLLGVPKALFGGKSNKVPLNALWDSVSTQDGYITQKMTIERLKRDGELTEAEAKDRLDNLELGRNEYLNNPILSGDMGGLDAGQKQNYFARILNEAILKKQADAVTDPNLKKQYEQQIKESEAIREKIYKGEIKVTPENEELTKQEFEKKQKEQPTIDQDRVLGDEEVVVSQSDEELLTTLQELAQVGVKNRDLQFFVDQAANAPNQFIETYGEQVTQELLDKATTEQIQKGLEDAKKFENNPNVSLLEKELERRGKTIADFVAPQAEAGSGGVGLTDKARTERREKYSDIINAKGSTFWNDIKLENAKIGDEFRYEEYKDGQWIKHKTKVKDIVDGEVIFENGQTQKNISSYMNITAEDMWFAKNIPEADSGGVVDVLKDVESTAKALEGVDVNDLEKQIGVVYHGTNSDFTEFDENKIGATDDGWYGKGFYFHTDKNRGGYGDIVKSAIVSLKNPLKLPTENAGRYLYDIIGKASGLDISFRDKSPMAIIRGIGSDKFTDISKKLGYDGVEINYSEGTKEIVSFDKNNIKIIDKKAISEAYHKAKADGSNPELVKAVEQSLKEQPKAETPTQETKPVSEPTTPPTTQAKELADKVVGKYEKKAREIAEKIQKSELPDWLKADLPDGTKKAGASYDQLKKALADTVIEMGRLLDRGVEYSQAIKQAVKDLVSLQGEENRDTIEKGFEKYYTDQTQQQPPPPQTPKQEPKEVGGEEEKPSGIKKALVSQKTLQEVNLEKVSDKEMMSLGKEIINSGEVKPRELVEKIISEKTGVLTPTEVVALITYKADLDNKEREIYEEINKRKEAGEDLGTLQVEAKEIERQIQDYEVMAVITAASQSMAFRLRQKMLDRDYNVITQIEKYKSKNNGVIPQDVENKFRELGKQIEELKKKLFEAESKIEKEAEIDAVNNIKESVDRETAYTEEELNKKIQEGVENEISKIYESLPEEKKSAADKAISALEKFRAKIKSRTYESTLGLPLAIADLGALTAIRAIKVGKTVAEAVEIGIKRIKQALKDKGINKWDEENDYRNQLTKTLEEEGVSLKKVKDKPIYNEDGSVSIPHQMIRDLVSKGYTDIESLTDEVYKEVVKELPEITKREVRDYITKYGKEVNPTKDEIEIKINQAKRIGRLLSELEDLQKRKVRSKNVLPLRLTEREKGLKRQIRTLAKDLVPKEELSDVEKISAAKERVKNRISELNRRIRNKDFAKPKKVIKPTDEELNKLMAKKERLQEEFETEQYRLEIKNRGFWKKAEDWLMELTNGLVRGLVASFDLSAGFVQGFWRLFTNPIKSLSAFGQMFKHLLSEKNAQEYLDKIKASPYYPLMKASKLAIDDKSGKVSVKEGFFISNWVNFIWDKGISSILGFGTKMGINFFRKINPYAASQRAFDGYVNSIRVQSFIELAKALEKEGMTYESNPKDFEKAADFVNTTTGRGGLGQADSSSRWLNIFLFAPRKVISEVKLFTPYAFAYYARMPKSVRKKAFANFIKFISLYFTTNALLWAARKDWDEDDEDDNFWNPNSSDFLTHKINNKRISIGGGMKSILTFQSRLFSGKYTDQYGQTSNLGERYGKTVNTRLDLVWRYILGKASPAVSVASKKLDEKKGIEVDDSEIIKNLTIPIWLQDLKELYKDNPTEVNAFLTMMAILGANTRTVKKDYKIPTKIEIEGAKVELNSEQQEFLETEIERRRDMYMEKAKSNRDYENLSDKRKFEISDEINKKAVKEAEQLLVKDRRYKTFFKQKAKQIKEEEKSKKELKEQEKDFINKIIK